MHGNKAVLNTPQAKLKQILCYAYGTSRSFIVNLKLSLCLPVGQERLAFWQAAMQSNQEMTGLRKLDTWWNAFITIYWNVLDWIHIFSWSINEIIQLPSSEFANRDQSPEKSCGPSGTYFKERRKIAILRGLLGFSLVKTWNWKVLLLSELY